MGRYDGEIVGIERYQFERIGRRHKILNIYSLMRWIDAPQAESFSSSRSKPRSR